ncbi:MAG: hypothetical protein GF347_02340, partial [Candidatus Moranbacteria bacterium]|nr:hypothetical protein [Candidatus Moranbacteria bacterium]
NGPGVCFIKEKSLGALYKVFRLIEQDQTPVLIFVTRNNFDLSAPVPEGICFRNISNRYQTLKILRHALKSALQNSSLSIVACFGNILTQKLNQPVYKANLRPKSNQRLPLKKDVEKLAAIIDSAKKPVVLVDVENKSYAKPIELLVKRTKAVVALTQQSKGLINEKKSEYAGILGKFGHLETLKALRESDLIILIGSGLALNQNWFFSNRIWIIQIHNKACEIGLNFEVKKALIGDFKPTLKQVLKKIKTKRGNRINRAFNQKVQKLKKGYLSEIDRLKELYQVPIHPGFLIAKLSESLKKDALITLGPGINNYWFFKYFLAVDQKVIFSKNSDAGNFAIAAAITAKLNHPQRQVVCLIQAADLLQSLADFTTIVQEKLDVKIVVFNYAKIQKSLLEKDQKNAELIFSAKVINPDFSKFAKNCGAEGYLIKIPRLLTISLKKAFNNPGPAILDIQIDSKEYFSS